MVPRPRLSAAHISQKMLEILEGQRLQRAAVNTSMQMPWHQLTVFRRGQHIYVDALIGQPPKSPLRCFESFKKSLGIYFFFNICSQWKERCKSAVICMQIFLHQISDRMHNKHTLNWNIPRSLPPTLACSWDPIFVHSSTQVTILQWLWSQEECGEDRITEAE